jgi:FtsH-binding integral membrane protein
MTFMLSMISVYNDTYSVIIAAGMTLFLSIGITLVAMQTRYDFTNCWFVAVCLVFALFGYGFASLACYRYMEYMQVVYGGIGALLMSIFLAIDTQLVLGKNKFRFSAEDYINACKFFWDNFLQFNLNNSFSLLLFQLYNCIWIYVTCFYTYYACLVRNKRRT